MLCVTSAIHVSTAVVGTYLVEVLGLEALYAVPALVQLSLQPGFELLAPGSHSPQPPDVEYA